MMTRLFICITPAFGVAQPEVMQRIADGEEV